MRLIVISVISGFLATGSLAFFLYKKIDRIISGLLAELSTLRREIGELKSELKAVKTKPVSSSSLSRSKNRSYSSVNTLSDEYEDALDFDVSVSTTILPDTRYLQEFDSVDEMLNGDGSQKEAVFQWLNVRYKENCTNPEYLWRYAKALIEHCRHLNGDKEQEKQLVFKAKDVAFQSLQLNPNCAATHKWCAIALGRVGDFLPLNDKIKNGFLFREHIEKAIEISPEDSTSYYLLGRWCYGVYMLSWLERKVAATLFASPPTSTAEEALQNFMTAETLKPNTWPENQLYIAKCYIQMSQFEEAADWFDKAYHNSHLDEEEPEVQQEIRDSYEKYQSYLKVKRE